MLRVMFSPIAHTVTFPFSEGHRYKEQNRLSYSFTLEHHKMKLLLVLHVHMGLPSAGIICCRGLIMHYIVPLGLSEITCEHEIKLTRGALKKSNLT